jgi:serine/threonine-protein kinase HipA
MSELSLDVRLDGYAAPIGTLARATSGNVAFRYSAEHLSALNALPLSLSFPLTDEPFGDVATRAFFDNLLQERDQPLKEVRERHNIERDDLVGLLFHMGADCAGAISILPEGSPPTKVPGNLEADYELVTSQELEDIVLALHNRSPLPNEMRDPSPLAGVQSKLSILLLENEAFALPKLGTGAPTTHILKVPDRQHLADPQRESLALALSSLCGVHTVLPVHGKIADIPILITPRFDRPINSKGQIIRLHQEDFAQALSLPPSLKYERRGIEGRSFNARAIGKLLNEIANPDIGRNTMLKLTLFDLLVGNVDGHAKNHALLYNERLRPNLSPRYDILPTRLDDSFNDELSYSIGTASKFEDVDQQQFFAFLSNLGISRFPAQKRLLSSALDQIATILADQLEVLQTEGQKPFADLIAANMRVLLPKFGYPVPKEAQMRDAHVVRGGGWLTS